MKLVFSIAGLNLNTIVWEKTPDKCMFYGWWFENTRY